MSWEVRSKLTTLSSQTPLSLTKSSRPKRVLDFDTENRPGFYWYDGKTTDMLMCVSWAWVDGGPVESLLLEWDPHMGLGMPSLRPFYEALDEADAVTGHNIKRHDIPLLNAHEFRIGGNELEWRDLEIIDTMSLVPGTKGMSRSQANLGTMLDLAQEKMSVNLPVWEDAAAGNPEALAVIKERCESDVLMHIEMYKALTQ